MDKKIRLFNTLTGKKEDLVPIEDKKIGIYVCGPTVYDSPHLGHARAAVMFDVMTRFLKLIGYDVTYVRNYTDVDDKIINKSTETGIPSEEIANTYIAEYKEAMESLGVRAPDYEPKVTEHIPEIIELTRRIIDAGYAYKSGGDVFFSIKKFKDYGEPSWDSPWGKGRPGWHIECSTMSMKYLGNTFEIHGGGKDLIFPHHENEIAQSEAATGSQFAKYWLHNGLIQINREKMSKSLGNIINVKDALKRWSKEAIRLFFLSHQYQNPADFSEKIMDESEAGLERLYLTLKRLRDLRKDNDKMDNELEERTVSFKQQWMDAMCDDFNTAEAIGNLFDLSKAINRSIDAHGWTKTLDLALTGIKNIGGVFGILEANPDEYLTIEKLSKIKSDLTEQEINRLIEERTEARKEKDWQRADEIRSYLLSKSIILEDKSHGTIWRIKN
jgi:cysteinyl-tRNA synthetase